MYNIYRGSRWCQALSAEPSEPRTPSKRPRRPGTVVRAVREPAAAAQAAGPRPMIIGPLAGRWARPLAKSPSQVGVPCLHLHPSSWPFLQGDSGPGPDRDLLKKGQTNSGKSGISCFGLTSRQFWTNLLDKYWKRASWTHTQSLQSDLIEHTLNWARLAISVHFCPDSSWKCCDNFFD